MTRFRPYAPGQLLLLPPNLDDWLKEDHLARFIGDTVDELDLSEFFADYQHDTDRGQPAYHPAMMLKVLLYAYCVGVMSSRKIDKACWDDVAFRVLSADQHPDHVSVARFRKRHLKAIAKLFKQVLKLAQKAGLVKLGVVALDGTKIKANASKHKAMSYERMIETEKRLEKEIEELLHRAQKTDEEEDTRYGQGKVGDDIPAELARRESRLETIRKAKAALEEEAKLLAEAEEKLKAKQKNKSDKGTGGKPKSGRTGGSKAKKKTGQLASSKQRNFTDPESRIMWHTSSKSFEQSYNAQAAVDKEAQIIVATSVTQDGNDKQQLVPMVKEIRRATGASPHTVLADSGYCSEKNLSDKSLEDIELLIPPDRMHRKLKTAECKSVYRLRKAIVEPVFGQIKHARSFRQFLLRGKESVSHEWDLICLTHNLRKLFTKGWRPAGA